MIVRMKKIMVLVQSKDTDPTLGTLRKLGVLHIEHQNIPKSESIFSLEGKYNSLLKAIEVLDDVELQKHLPKPPEEIVSEILRLLDRREFFTENLKNIKKDIDTWMEWGDFDPEVIEDLRNKGIWVRLCKITKRETHLVPEGVILEEIFKKGKVLYCSAISRKEINLPFPTLALPEQGIEEMLLRKKEEEENIGKIEKELVDFSAYKGKLLSYKKELESLIEFNRVTAGMGRFEKLSYLKGYSPIYNANLIEKTAAREKWGIIIEDPDENDNAPTLIKNPRWVEMIRPVFQMIKTIPGYREVDISLWFLLFFSVFFGMLIGDAGYGLVFFIVNLICHKKLRHRLKDRSIFSLMYVLSSCAIIWGVLSGTFFGQAWLPKRVEPLLPYLREDITVQALCFLIGALHLSVAHMWRFLRKMPSVKAFSEIGWVFMLWTAYFIAKSLILGQSFPWFGKWLLVLGAGMIILFANPGKNIFKTIGSGVGDFLFHVVNSFTDVVSYIRLFAVGAATVAVADAFNQMASGIGHSNLILGLVTALVLLFGHTLNILLGAMAILVHGVRLNVLEFSSHLNMEWSGIEYAPFKDKGDQDGYESIGPV